VELHGVEFQFFQGVEIQLTIVIIDQRDIYVGVEF